MTGSVGGGAGVDIEMRATQSHKHTRGDILAAEITKLILLSCENTLSPENSVPPLGKCRCPGQREAAEPRDHRAERQTSLVVDSSGEEDTLDSCLRTEHQQSAHRFPWDRALE